jgi:PIN domain nuclease of toxin-antitoxin system
MNALLDTHSFLWAVMEPEKLSAKVRKVIADPANRIHLSTVSFWEISLKFALGKLEFSGCQPEDLVSIAREMRLDIVAPSPEEAAGFHRLPRMPHKDPFDRMLIRQCLQSQWVFLTRDQALDDYQALGLKTFW